MARTICHRANAVSRLPAICSRRLLKKPSCFDFARIATLTFNRPEKRNPLNEEIVLELEGLLHQVRDDKDARVLIFTGTGNTFSAGADLTLVKGITDQEERQRI